MASDSDSRNSSSQSSSSRSSSADSDRSGSSRDSQEEEQKIQDNKNNKRMSQFGQYNKAKFDDYNHEINENDEYEDKIEDKTQKTGNLIGKGLKNMEEYLQQEEEIINYCQQNSCQWIDKEFPADNRALFRIPHKVPEWAREVKQITWKRPQEISPRDARFIQDKEWDVKQGAFGESWFIGALVIISTRGEFIEKLFVDKDHFDMGFVTFQFFKNGEWRPVVIDTLLPYDQDSKLVCYGQNNNPFEYWIPLMEKAYSKLHGCYQNIIEDFSFIEGLTDLTGGVSELHTIKDPDDNKKKQLWNMMLSHFNQKYYLGCVNFEDGKGTKNADTGPHGILENHHYGILDIREFPREDLKLIRIRNPWGADGGWNGPFSDDSEEWDRHRLLRDELKLVFKSKKQDGTWWMAFDHFCEQFNRLFICKVFPESWQTYSIESKWQGVTAGGICPPKFDLPDNIQEQNFDCLQLDSDERWFNNPQFRIKVEKETKLFISLMQEDEKLCKTNYIKCNFMVIANRNKKNRIWERPVPQDIVAEALSKKDIENYVPQREITISVTLRKFEGKNFGYYMIIPNTVTDNKKEEQRPFWLRLFASENIDVYEMPETIEESVEDQWTYDSAGGRRKFEGKDNPAWCKNPQYFLNMQKPTHLKIILRKIGNVKKTRNIKIGMTICRFNQLKKTKKIEQNKKNQPLQSISSIADKSKNINIGLNRLINQTVQHLEAPEMEYIERKLQILPGEHFKESAYISEEVAALYFNWNPTEGPFIIVPSLDQGKEEKTQNFKLTIFSNNPIQLQKLEESKNAVLIGKWEQEISDGGCHLYEDPFEKDISRKTWTLNPQFLLQFKDYSLPTYLKITLAIADKNWKAKTKNAVGGMIGIYLVEKRDTKMSVDHWVREPSFMPLTCHSEEFELKELNKQGYIIMPTTYESRIRGQFILSVTSDRDFTLTA